jgi:hypothetical protein
VSKPKKPPKPKPGAAEAEAILGRPPIDEALRRTWRVAVTVNRAELDIMKAAAKAADQTVSDWSREILLAAAKESSK